MFEEFNAKYEDFCWYEITNELSKNNIEKQAKQLAQFDAEHRKMLEEKYPERFTVRHKVFFTWYYM